MSAAIVSFPQATFAPLAITAGEPAGIGPDLCVKLAAAPPDIPFVVIADKHLLQERAAQLGISLQVRDAGSGESAAMGREWGAELRVFSPTYHLLLTTPYL